MKKITLMISMLLFSVIMIAQNPYIQKKIVDGKEVIVHITKVIPQKDSNYALVIDLATNETKLVIAMADGIYEVLPELKGPSTYMFPSNYGSSCVCGYCGCSFSTRVLNYNCLRCPRSECNVKIDSGWTWFTCDTGFCTTFWIGE